MDLDVVLGFRNLLLCGAIVSSVSLAPDAAHRLSLRIRNLASSIPAWFRSLRDTLREKNRSGFWEIDMTKFEP